MNGGESALRGHLYQQRYLAFRVLASVAAQAIDSYDAGLTIVEFAIESRSTVEGPVWDVRFRLTDDTVHLRECKDTNVTSEDRLAFYRRMRRELYAGTPPERLRVGWAVNPEKQTTKILDHLSGMIGLARTAMDTVVPDPPSKVNSPETALSEALHVLCSPGENDNDSPPCSIDAAKTLLEGLVIDKHRLADLEQSVKILATGVFSNGTGEAIATFITGQLTEAICAGRAQYTPGEFVQAVGRGAVALQAPDNLRKLITFNSAKGNRPSIRVIEWRRLPGQFTKEWPLAERLPGFVSSSAVILAGMGAGKTVTSQQVFAEETLRRDPHHVLRIEVEVFDPTEMDSLLSLGCILSGLGPTCLIIDGVDEIPRDCRQQWTAFLDRLQRIPNLTLVLTARVEVWTAYSWLQRIAAALPPRELGLLTSDQIQEELARVQLPAPRSAGLLRVLQNPFLLSLYARVVTPDDMPLADSGQVTAFQVIEEFWQRAVVTTSSGHRAVGEEERSQHFKQMAVAELVQRTMLGELVVSREGFSSDAAAGVEMLIREGVVIRQGTHAIRWSHEWIREYAFIDALIARLVGPNIRSLVGAVEHLGIDYVLREAATGALKWVIAHPEWGSAQEFLVELWNRCRGPASDVLPVLMEGDDELLELATLPIPLLIEAIKQAHLLRAYQWRQQIAMLPPALFAGDDGERLQEVATEYEVEIQR